MSTVLITGGNGLVGSSLSKKLTEKGYTVKFLRRNQNNLKSNEFYWDIENQKVDPLVFESVDYIIHLAGENISTRRWTKAQKSKILDSRLNSSKLLIETLKAVKNKPKAIISASAVGYYGFDEPSKTFTELDPAANDFLGKVCFAWENEVKAASEMNIRNVQLRTGIVLSKNGGALDKMNKPIKMGIGSPLGSGNQFMPWIHIDDLCEMYITAMENDNWNGAYNAVAPEHKTNAEFTSLLASVQNKKSHRFNVPGFILKIVLGKMSSIVLQGNMVSCEKITDEGFIFNYPTLKKALDNIFNNH